MKPVYNWDEKLPPYCICCAQLRPTLCDPLDCSPPGSCPWGFSRILEWVAMPFSRGSSQCRDRTQVSCIVGRFFTIWITREAPSSLEELLKWKIYDPESHNIVAKMSKIQLKHTHKEPGKSQMRRDNQQVSVPRLCLCWNYLTRILK